MDAIRDIIDAGPSQKRFYTLIDVVINNQKLQFDTSMKFSAFSEDNAARKILNRIFQVKRHLAPERGSCNGTVTIKDVESDKSFSFAFERNDIQDEAMTRDLSELKLLCN